MLTQICTLTWPDGAVLTGRLEAISPESAVPVTYSGATDRVPAARLFPECNPSFLTTLFGNLGRDLDAAVGIEQTGEFDEFAQ